MKSKLDAVLEENIITRVHDQNTIEKAHSCLIKTIIQAAERYTLKVSSEVKRRLPVAWWNEEFEREERMARANIEKINSLNSTTPTKVV